VVALDWKWLFIYPDYGIATVNEMAAPVNEPIDFQITASSVMNAFFVPALAGQIYAMPGMETQLHAVINKPGSYDGFSANYSGAGFSDMHFRFLGLNRGGFEAWVDRARHSEASLSRDAYLVLERPSQREPVRRYAAVASGLYDAIVNMCVAPGTMCLNRMMAIDAHGGAGVAADHMTGHADHDADHQAAGEATGGHEAGNVERGQPPQTHQSVGEANTAATDKSKLLALGAAAAPARD
jgi:cytochrome o ubiquinol oxidase subunit 2